MASRTWTGHRGEEKEGVVQRAPLDETSELAGAPGGAASKHQGVYKVIEVLESNLK